MCRLPSLQKRAQKLQSESGGVDPSGVGLCLFKEVSVSVDGHADQLLHLMGSYGWFERSAIGVSIDLLFMCARWVSATQSEK